jgi:hypothetical protein
LLSSSIFLLKKRCRLIEEGDYIFLSNNVGRVRNMMDIFEKEISNKAIILGNTLLFQRTDAVDVIKKCKELNIKILGVESFEINEKKRKPLIDGILDCSYDGNNEGCWSEAIKFIEMQRQGLVFEIIYDL